MMQSEEKIRRVLETISGKEAQDDTKDNALADSGRMGMRQALLWVLESPELVSPGRAMFDSLADGATHHEARMNGRRMFIEQN